MLTASLLMGFADIIGVATGYIKKDFNLGAVLLNWIDARKFLVGTAVLALLSMLAMIFAITLEKMPDRANEVSDLMIRAISGGAIIPPLMGIMSANVGMIASLIVLVVCMLYILGVNMYALKN